MLWSSSGAIADRRSHDDSRQVGATVTDLSTLGVTFSIAVAISNTGAVSVVSNLPRPHIVPKQRLGSPRDRKTTGIARRRFEQDAYMANPG